MGDSHCTACSLALLPESCGMPVPRLKAGLEEAEGRNHTPEEAHDTGEGVQKEAAKNRKET